jgi:hypothetical protein
LEKPGIVASFEISIFADKLKLKKLLIIT